MKHALIFLFLIAFFTAGQSATADNGHIITAAQWSRPRSGAMVAALPPVRATVQAWLQDTTRKIVILHTGDDTGTLWASELEDWLVSLGIPAADIELKPGGVNEDQLRLIVEAPEN